jgi:hypothetical protein
MKELNAELVMDPWKITRLTRNPVSFKKSRPEILLLVECPYFEEIEAGLCDHYVVFVPFALSTLE